MEFFTDKNFKLDVENKLNHYEILLGTNGTLSAHTVWNSNTNAIANSANYQVYKDLTNDAIVLVSSIIDNLHIFNTSSKLYAQETKIANNAKKFVLE